MKFNIEKKIPRTNYWCEETETKVSAKKNKTTKQNKKQEQHQRKQPGEGISDTKKNHCVMLFRMLFFKLEHTARTTQTVLPLEPNRFSALQQRLADERRRCHRAAAEPARVAAERVLVELAVGKRGGRLQRADRRRRVGIDGAIHAHLDGGHARRAVRALEAEREQAEVAAFLCFLAWALARCGEQETAHQGAEVRHGQQRQHEYQHEDGVDGNDRVVMLNKKSRRLLVSRPSSSSSSVSIGVSSSSSLESLREYFASLDRQSLNDVAEIVPITEVDGLTGTQEDQRQQGARGIHPKSQSARTAPATKRRRERGLRP